MARGGDRLLEDEDTTRGFHINVGMLAQGT